MRFLRFSVVGLAGIVVQVTMLAVFVEVAGVHYLPASVVALGCAVAHNYVWHARWTWRDRGTAGRRHSRAFVRFAGANGVVSLAGAVALMPLLVDVAGLPVVAANLGVIAATGLANFVIADRWSFGARAAAQISRSRISGGGISQALDGPASRRRIAATTR